MLKTKACLPYLGLIPPTRYASSNLNRMLKKERIKKLVEKYLTDKRVSHTKLLDDFNKITLWKNKEILHGKRKGQIADIYTYRYLDTWVQEEKGMIVSVDAHSAELLYIMTPHGYIDIED
ncbi:MULTISPECIES: hypothetical protein [unclassified Flavobacterium]|uniref:hypothetical protein n=1 Tax=unclassified Flavobacterium TaxID=196869 RepID=UPI001F129DD1|nr:MULTISPECIES: hypothetical protein [unclassified Flavobacterium]UMY66467.1 hypothetical protein MKO97_03540 [Flavobacterium sp. HJ-32-4]